MKITFYGQNSLAIEVSGTHILVDPFISENPLSKDKVDILKLKADYILLTHAHEDHILDAEAIAKNTGAKIVSNYEIAMYYQAKGINVHPMNILSILIFFISKLFFNNSKTCNKFLLCQG